MTSYSRTAAAELAGRDLPIAPDRVGTLHSHCYHALGGPVIAESCVDEWNSDNPHLAITPAKKHVRLDGEGVPERKTTPNWPRTAMRSFGVEPHARPDDPAEPLADRAEPVQAEVDAVQAGAIGLLDFTDLIETATGTSMPRPGTRRSSSRTRHRTSTGCS